MRSSQGRLQGFGKSIIEDSPGFAEDPRFQLTRLTQRGAWNSIKLCTNLEGVEGFIFGHSLMPAHYAKAELAEDTSNIALQDAAQFTRESSTTGRVFGDCSVQEQEKGMRR